MRDGGGEEREKKNKVERGEEDKVEERERSERTAC